MSNTLLLEPTWSTQDITSILDFSDVTLGILENYSNVTPVDEDYLSMQDYAVCLFMDVQNVKSKKKKPAAQMYAAAPVAVQAAARRGLQLASEFSKLDALKDTDLLKLSETIAKGSSINSDGLLLLQSFGESYAEYKNAKSSTNDVSNGRLTWLLLGGDAGAAWTKTIFSELDPLPLPEKQSSVSKERNIFSEPMSQPSVQPTPVQFFTSMQSYGGVAKVPVCVLGSWKHPEYGEVVNTQQDFNDMIANWQSNVTGYEPPLFVGHPVDTDTVEGAPAAGFLAKLYQEGSVLYGEYDVVDDEVYADVDGGKFRYSSSELVRNAVSKVTGKPIGTLLVGCALTNRPFLTGLPRVETVKQQFSETNSPIYTNIPITMTSESTPVLNIQPVVATSTAADPTAAYAEQFAELAAKVETLSLKLVESYAKNEDLSQRLSELTDERKAIKLSDKLAVISTLNISAAAKEQYSELIKAGDLSSTAETTFFNMLENQSKENTQRYGDVRGTTSDRTSELPAEENPYAATIQANKEAYAARLVSQRI